jgi:hypothetical protein
LVTDRSFIVAGPDTARLNRFVEPNAVSSATVEGPVTVSVLVLTVSVARASVVTVPTSIVDAEISLVVKEFSVVSPVTVNVLRVIGPDTAIDDRFTDPDIVKSVPDISLAVTELAIRGPVTLIELKLVALVTDRDSTVVAPALTFAKVEAPNTVSDPLTVASLFVANSLWIVVWPYTLTRPDRVDVPATVTDPCNAVAPFTATVLEKRAGFNTCIPP